MAVLFAFDGGAGAWPGRGLELVKAEPAFRDALEATCALASGHAGFDVLAALITPRLEPSAAWTSARNQGILRGSLQIAQCDLWRAAGVQPDAVLAISLGEVAAAYAADALRREDAVTVLCALSDAWTAHRIACVLFVIEATAADARRLCDTAPAPLDFHGTSSPTTSTVLCTEDDAGATRAHLATVAIASEHSVDYPYHTMRGPLDREELRRRLLGIEPRRPDRPFFAASAGRDISADARFDADHWGRVITDPYLYAEAVTAALARGHRRVVRIGVQSVVTQWLAATAHALGHDLELIDTMRGDEPGPVTWLRARRAVRPRAA